MSEKTNKNVPELRFKGFSDAWVQRKLLDGYKKIRNAFVGTATPFYVESGHFYLESNNVKNGQLNFNSKVFINDEFYQKQTDQLLNTGDLVMVQSGHVGHTAVIPQELDGTAAHALIMFKNNDGSFDSDFVNQYFQTDRAKNAISIITTGNTIKHILASDMQKFDVTVPSIDEQNQISLLLNRLDNLIAANQRKLDSLKAEKRAYLQRFFTQTIRFSGYTSPWFNLVLSDVSTEVKGNDGRTDLPVLTISAANGWMNQKDRFSAVIAGTELGNYTLLKQGELSYNHGNSKLAKFGAVFSLESYKEALVPRVYHSFRVNNKANAKFIEYMFATKIPDRELAKLVSSGARMDGLLNINKSEFMGIKITIPTVEEQTRIADFLSKHDLIIEAYEQKEQLLQTQKRAYLQKMFI